MQREHVEYIYIYIKNENVEQYELFSMQGPFKKKILFLVISCCDRIIIVNYFAHFYLIHLHKTVVLQRTEQKSSPVGLQGSLVLFLQHWVIISISESSVGFGMLFLVRLTVSVNKEKFPVLLVGCREEDFER